jgi:hypothetical protein
VVTVFDWTLHSNQLQVIGNPLLPTYSPCGPPSLFLFLNLYIIGRAPSTGHQPVARPLPTERTPSTQNKRTQPSMPRVGFEPTIPVFERAKTVHVLDRAAAVIGDSPLSLLKKTEVELTLSSVNIEDMG